MQHVHQTRDRSVLCRTGLDSGARPICILDQSKSPRRGQGASPPHSPQTLSQKVLGSFKIDLVRAVPVHGWPFRVSGLWLKLL